jgi:2-polyprenyl-3-methyl-5-hydroxy-6-metoxy-1,4-benzoquinol methylase
MFLASFVFPNRNRFKRAIFHKFLDGISSPLFILYVTYALENRTRGIQNAERFFRDKPSIESFLDVGCAYGGTVLAMEASGVRRSVGFDLDSGWINLAMLQQSDLRVKSVSKFLVGSIEDSDFCASLQQFDVVSCIDVLEHVMDIETTIKNLHSLLNKGGFLYCDITNGFSLKNVESDSHHQLFASVLLDRKWAEKQFHHHFGDNLSYDVGHFPTLDWFEDRFRKNNLSFEILTYEPQLMSKEPIRDSAILIGEKLDEYLSQNCLENDLREHIINRVSAFLKQIEGDLEALNENQLSKKYLHPIYKVKSINLLSSEYTAI